MVLGYNTQTRESLTGALSVVKDDKLKDITSPSLTNMLNGKAAGVYVANGSGQPGSSGAVVIRGQASLSGSTAPIWIIDGVNVGTSAGCPNYMESMVYIVLTGILIGALISAPMGPIGMLVIQRTLNKGRAAAFFTGIGASLSDFLYCLLAGLGMSFVTDFIESNQNVLQVIGSLVLLIFGFYLFRNNPSRNLTAPAEPANTYWKDFATGFLFTFSNPLIQRGAERQV